MTPLYRACWALWVCGTALIVLSWVDVVPVLVGWVGFGVALVGTLLSFVAQGSPRRLPPRVEDQPPDQERPTSQGITAERPRDGRPPSP
jgi:hypothetical protein